MLIGVEVFILVEHIVSFTGLFNLVFTCVIERLRAIEYTYVEILTRKPSAEEITEAVEIIESGADHMAGFADFRWILLNSNEFLYVD